MLGGPGSTPAQTLLSPSGPPPAGSGHRGCPVRMSPGPAAQRSHRHTALNGSGRWTTRPPPQGPAPEPGPRSPPRDSGRPSRGPEASGPTRLPSGPGPFLPLPTPGAGQAAAGLGRARLAAGAPPLYLLDVHGCRGWGRRPPRCLLLPPRSPPAPPPPDTTARPDPGPPLPPPPAPPAATELGSGPRSPLTKQNGGGATPSPSRRDPFGTGRRERAEKRSHPSPAGEGTRQKTLKYRLFK